MTSEELVIEVAEWRRMHTWGGFVWPSGRKEFLRWRRSEEVLDEAQWQLDMGMHPSFAARAVGMSAMSLQRLAYRHGRRALANAFVEEITFERRAAA